MQFFSDIFDEILYRMTQNMFMSGMKLCRLLYL